MRLFWPIYLTSVVVGTAAVFMAAPLARPFVSRGYGAERAGPAEAAAPEAAPAPAPAAAPQPAARPAAAQAVEDDDAPPAMLGVYRASSGDRPEWGVTGLRTTYYKLDGMRQGTVPGGVLFDVARARQSSKGAMLECLFLHNGATNGPFLVSRKDVTLFTASHAKLSSRQLDALKAYYALNGKIGARKTDLLQASASKNPYYAAANAAYQTYLAHVSKAKELAAKRETTTELARARLEDELREMKVAEVKIKADLDAANQKFREWKEQHAAEIAKPENDPEIKRWTAEMAELRKVVPGLAM